MKESDRYAKIVEWSEEDNCYIGRCPGLMHGGVHGDDEAEVYRELCEVVEETLADCRAQGDPLPPPTAGKTYSGKFVLRIDPELHMLLDRRAMQNDESLNAYCAAILRRGATRLVPVRKKTRREHAHA